MNVFDENDSSEGFMMGIRIIALTLNHLNS